MYAKVFAQIYDGTLCTKGPWQALVTFQQLLVLADQDGNVDMTASAISRRTTIPMEIISLGIDELLKDDPESRTPTENGRRILPLCEGRAWGWKIVNYKHYRALKREEERRNYHREYWHKRKDKLNKKLNNSTKSTELNDAQQNQPIAEAEAEAYAENHIGNSLPRCPVDKIVDLYHQVLPELPKVIAVTEKRKASIKQRWNQIKPETEDDGLEGFKDYFTLVRSSDFLMGKKPATNGHKVFIANLEWLVNESNFVKVAERNYHERV